MRKRVLQHVHQPEAAREWLDIERLAEVEVSSEVVHAPIEQAFAASAGSGWSAAEPGVQIIRLLFDEPQRLQRIWLRFVESAEERTQEFVLRWSHDRGQSFHEIVRQRWNFSPSGATNENEDYRVDLRGVTELELTIIPDVSGGAAIASLAAMRVA
jgi:hypothetical protein